MLLPVVTDSKIIILFFAFQTCLPLTPFYPKYLNNFGANINLKIYATEINALLDNRSPMYLKFKERVP